jgi:Protein of unknown function with HXXEE motif
MKLPTLSALFVGAVLLHNLEEAIWLPGWAQSGGGWHQPVTPAVFGFSAVVLSLLLVLLAWRSWRSGPQSISAYLYAGYVFAMIANAAVPHLVGTIWLGSYMPGTATAVLLNAPLGAWLLVRLHTLQQVSLRRMCWVGPLVAAGLLASIPFLFFIGDLLPG